MSLGYEATCYFNERGLLVLCLMFSRTYQQSRGCPGPRQGEVGPRPARAPWSRWWRRTRPPRSGDSACRRGSCPRSAPRRGSPWSWSRCCSPPASRSSPPPGQTVHLKLNSSRRINNRLILQNCKSSIYTTERLNDNITGTGMIFTALSLHSKINLGYNLY